MAAGYGAQAGDIAAMLALHAERGGESPQAVHYWQQASEQAARRHAYHEAVACLRKGLAVLATLPASRERTRHELTLLLSLGERLMATQGMAAPEVGEVYTRAHTLCHQVGELPQRLLVEIFSRCTEGFVTPDLQKAQELLEALTGELPNIPGAIGARRAIVPGKIMPA